MKNKLFSLAIVSILAFTTDYAFAQGHRHGGMGGDIGTGNVETFSGTVLSADTVSRGCCMTGKGVHVTLKTAEETLTVAVGPSFYVEGKMSFQAGDTITVQGVRISEDGGTLVVAKEIRKGGEVLSLRGDDGTPNWAGEGHRRWN